ncbi:hypothetical protein C0J52_25810 [Blattella germanica]|nr:hypothetical protein C0J52_25810 [Blattella germanica]
MCWGPQDAGLDSVLVAMKARDLQDVDLREEVLLAFSSLIVAKCHLLSLGNSLNDSIEIAKKLGVSKLFVMCVFTTFNHFIFVPKAWPEANEVRMSNGVKWYEDDIDEQQDCSNRHKDDAIMQYTQQNTLDFSSLDKYPKMQMSPTAQLYMGNAVVKRIENG